MTEKWKLIGFDTFEGEYYSIEGNHLSEKEAQDAANKKLNELEQSQPSVTSGGQGGIQDRVYIQGPDKTTYRVFPISQESAKK